MAAWASEVAANNAYLMLTRHGSNLVPDRMPLARTEIRRIGAALLWFTLHPL